MWGAVNRVQHILDNIRPLLQEDGHDIEFVGLENHTAIIHLIGIGCSDKAVILIPKVESLIKKVAPEIKSVEVVL